MITTTRVAATIVTAGATTMVATVSASGVIDDEPRAIVAKKTRLPQLAASSHVSGFILDAFV